MSFVWSLHATPRKYGNSVPSQFSYWNTRHMSPSITHHITHIHHQFPRPPLWADSQSATHHIAFVTRCSFTGLACQLPTWVHFLSFPIMSAVHLWLLMGAHIFHDALEHNIHLQKRQHISTRQWISWRGGCSDGRCDSEFFSLRLYFFNKDYANN